MQRCPSSRAGVSDRGMSPFKHCSHGHDVSLTAHCRDGGVVGDGSHRRYLELPLRGHRRAVKLRLNTVAAQANAAEPRRRIEDDGGDHFHLARRLAGGRTLAADNQGASTDSYGAEEHAGGGGAVADGGRERGKVLGGQGKPLNITHARPPTALAVLRREGACRGKYVGLVQGFLHELVEGPAGDEIVHRSMESLADNVLDGPGGEHVLFPAFDIGSSARRILRERCHSWLLKRWGGGWF